MREKALLKKKQAKEHRPWLINKFIMRNTGNLSADTLHSTLNKSSEYGPDYSFYSKVANTPEMKGARKFYCDLSSSSFFKLKRVALFADPKPETVHPQGTVF